MSAQVLALAPPYWQALPAGMQAPGKIGGKPSQHWVPGQSVSAMQPKPASNVEPPPPPVPPPTQVPVEVLHIAPARHVTQAEPADPWPHCALVNWLGWRQVFPSQQPWHVEALHVVPPVQMPD